MSIAKVKDNFLAISRKLLCCYSDDVNSDVRSQMSICNLSPLNMTTTTKYYQAYHTDAFITQNFRKY